MRTVLTIFLGGLVAGAFDLAYVFTVYGVRGISPIVILQSIASGLLGRAAYAGDVKTALLGLVLHFSMAFLMAAGFVVLVRVLPALLQRPLLMGPVYGVLLFVVMYYLVVPLSAAVIQTPSGWLLAGALFAHTVLVGTPIALFARELLTAKAP